MPGEIGGAPEAEKTAGQDFASSRLSSSPRSTRYPRPRSPEAAWRQIAMKAAAVPAAGRGRNSWIPTAITSNLLGQSTRSAMPARAPAGREGGDRPAMPGGRCAFAPPGRTRLARRFRCGAPGSGHRFVHEAEAPAAWRHGRGRQGSRAWSRRGGGVRRALPQPCHLVVTIQTGGTTDMLAPRDRGPAQQVAFGQSRV